VGLAGVNLPHLFTAINEWQHPFLRMYLTSDLHTACLGAHEGKEGAVIVVGTGSCGFSSVNGDTLNLGGHGFLMGDQGSGAWVGLEAIKAVLLAMDDLGPQTLLSRSLAQHLDCEGLAMVEEMTGMPSRNYAKIAPLVFTAAEQEDSVALNILKEAGLYISALANKLLATNPQRLSMIGGVSMRLLPWLDEAIVAQVVDPIEQPEFGAIHFAKNQMAAEEGIVTPQETCL
jgi:glucosamine kinase